MDDNTFKHIRVKQNAQRKVQVLARALDVDINSLIAYWADHEWESALKAGLVTGAMLKDTTKIKRNFEPMSTLGKA